jgi:hypothetical protein
MFNLEQPTIIEDADRIIVIGDVHGDIKRLLDCLYSANIFSKELKWIAEPQNTIVVQMGDQIDSLNRNGNINDWENMIDIEVMLLMEKLDKIAKINGGRVLSMIGNHEIMNVLGDYSYVSKNSIDLLPIESRKYQFSPGNRFANILSNRNIILKIGKCLFCHGGLLPHHLYLCNNNLYTINEIVRKFLKKEYMTEKENLILNLIAINEDSVLWTRSYVNLPDEELNNDIDNVFNITNSIVIFTGHNTFENITSKLNNKIIFTDAALSRAYNSEKVQYIDIQNNHISIKQNVYSGDKN